VPDYSDNFSTRFKWYEFSDPQAATNLYAGDVFKAAVRGHNLSGGAGQIKWRAMSMPRLTR
jgi:hypothetical protein